MNPNAETDLLAEFEELVRTDRLPGQGSAFFGSISKLADDFLSTGRFELPTDPFRGRDRELALQSDLYYVMFWRMFDRTPAAMMQDFAIKLRRILAKRVFKRCGEDVVIHHNVLFNSGRNIELGDGVFLNRDVMLDDRAALTIDDHAMIAAGVVIETHSHAYDDFSVPLPYGGRIPAPCSHRVEHPPGVQGRGDGGRHYRESLHRGRQLGGNQGCARPDHRGRRAGQGHQDDRAPCLRL